MSIRRSAWAVSVAAGTLAGGQWAAAQDVSNPGDLVVASSINFPAGEPPEAALDNTGSTKYLNFDVLNTGFTVTPSGFGVVRGISIVTANDAPQRDPASFVVEGSDDGVSFFVIAQGTFDPPVTRFAIAEATFLNETAYLQYRVTFPTVRTQSAANSMQVGEVQLLTAGDITSAADAVAVTYTPGAVSPAGQGGVNLLDNRLGTKLGVTGGNLGPTTVDITPAMGSTVVTGINVSGTGDDSVFFGRTPGDLTLMGSNDGVNYTPIFATGLGQVQVDYEDQQFFFANAAAYSRYRVVLGPSADAFMQLGELRLMGTASETAPANDECAAAQVITAGATVGSSFFATGTDVTACGSGDTADVWYRYTAAASGMVEANTCGVGTMDTTVAVFGSCGGASLGCDDNTCGVGGRVRWSAVGGQTYLIRVAGVDGATGGFTVAIDESPVLHEDVSVALQYNFNGMVHAGENGDPDNLDGYRSISDRGMDINGLSGAFGIGLEGETGIPYGIVTAAGRLDIVHLGNRNATDNGLQAFDAIPDGDNYGVQPSWLADVNQTVPQVTDVSDLGLVMGPETRIGVLHHASNGGGFFTLGLAFTDGSSVFVGLYAPDWFGDQDPLPPELGVETQSQLGTFAGAGENDNGSPSVPLNIVESVVSVPDLLADGFGDIEGRELQSITFSNASNFVAAHAIFAVTVRDAEAGGGCPADWSGDGTVNSSDISAFLTSWLASVTAPNLVADFNGDGATNSSDISAFLTAWLDAVINGC